MSTKPWKSGHCGDRNPPESHERCKGAAAGKGTTVLECSCFCHMAPDPSSVADAGEQSPEAEQPVAMRQDALAEEGPRLGVYDALDELAYHSDPTSISASGMKNLLRSPAHFLYGLDHPKQSDQMDLGTIAHTLVLGNGQEYVAIAGNRNSNAVKALIEEAEAAGKLVLKPAQLQAAERMAEAVLNHRTAGPLFTDPGRSEVSMFWRDPAFDVIRRCRWDRLRDDGVGIDLKSNRTANPEALDKAILEWRYDMSASWYLAVAAGLDIEIAAFAFVFVESTPPHPVVVVEPDDEFLARGAALAEKALTIYHNCLDAGTWPGYQDEGFLTIAPPRWAETAEQITATIPERTHTP